MLTRLKLLNLSVRRRFFREKASGVPSVLVVSAGGVATTALIRHISQFRDTNHLYDEDGLKHLPKPPIFSGRRPQVVFVYGREAGAMHSIVRRGWLLIQSAKIGAIAPVVLGDTGGSRRSYLRAVVRQQNAWRRYNGDLFCVRFEEIAGRKAELARFLSIDDPAFLDGFPVQSKGRQASCD